MKLISFDIGIKNMAICCFDISHSIVSITYWNVLNLMNDEMPKRFCTCTLKPKKGQSEAAICGKTAKYKKFDNFYCEKHAKSNKEFCIPTKGSSQNALKKMRVDELKALCKKYNIISDIQTKKTLLEFLDVYFGRTCYETIQERKKIGAGETDLVTIGKNMKRIFDEIENMANPDIVIIENQISPIANRMKTIQGMVAQYFIMKDSNIDIHFVSSANKLKDFQPLENQLRDNEEKTYAKNKKNGVEYCSQLLQSTPEFEKWISALDTKKKDDLADCFLQGIWYLTNKLNIMRRT